MTAIPTIKKNPLLNSKIEIVEVKKGPSILWRDWKDPLRSVLEDYEENHQDDEDEDDDGDSWKRKGKPSKTFKGPLLAGSFGLIPLREDNLPSNSWKFFVGNLNFPITYKVYRAMKNTEGVDIFKQWTRYRIWLGVGTNFEPADVKKAVEENAIKASGKRPRI